MSSLDLELVRTFVVIVETGSFLAAAERLHVTQAAVSRRIHTLEERLGCSLFTRNRSGATATLAGRRFQRHAASLLRTYEQARQELGAPDRFRGLLVVGSRFGLWEGLLIDWLDRVREQAPDICVRAEVGFEADLMHRLVEGSLDLGVMYTPQSRPGLEVERLFHEELLLVSSSETGGGPADGNYVYVDWGPEFRDRHMLAFAEHGTAGVVAGIGWLGLRHVLGHGGSGYFPRRLVAEYLADGRLRSVADAPVFRMPAYAVYPSGAQTEVLDAALTLLRGLCEAVDCER